jgi:hypothetical protein
MPSKGKWREAINQSDGSRNCPLCELAGKELLSPIRCYKSCIFSLYDHRVCVVAMREDLNFYKNERVITPERVEIHKKKFLLPWFKKLPNDHPFFQE